MDAAVAADAENAPTATWKTAQNAVSHSAHTHHSFVRREKSRKPDHASHTEFLTLPSSFEDLNRLLGIQRTNVDPLAVHLPVRYVKEEAVTVRQEERPGMSTL
jgi:hypothetical protein